MDCPCRMKDGYKVKPKGASDSSRREMTRKGRCSVDPRASTELEAEPW